MIAIDPGSSSGVIAVREPFGDRVNVYNMPATPEAILQFFREQNAGRHAVVMEDVGRAMPGNAARSAYTFARHRGHLEMALLAAGFTACLLVAPRKWMHELYGDALPTGRSPVEKKARKDFIWQDMVKHYPELKVTKRSADALAILTWARKEYIR